MFVGKFRSLRYLKSSISFYKFPFEVLRPGTTWRYLASVWFSAVWKHSGCWTWWFLAWKGWCRKSWLFKVINRFFKTERVSLTEDDEGHYSCQELKIRVVSGDLQLYITSERAAPCGGNAALIGGHTEAGGFMLHMATRTLASLPWCCSNVMLTVSTDDSHGCFLVDLMDPHS